MLPISDADIAEVIGTSVKDVGTLELNADLEKVRMVMKLVRVRPGTKETSARVADNNDVTEFDDSTTATIVDHAVLVRPRNSKGITLAKVASKVARLAVTVACHVVAAVDAEDLLVVTSAVISVEEEVADLRVVLVARTAK